MKRLSIDFFCNKKRVGELAIFVICTLLILSMATGSAAYARVNTHNEKDYLSFPSTTAAGDSDLYKTLIIDDRTNTKIAGWLVGDSVTVKSITVTDGVKCLHSKGSCSACDQLRNMYVGNKIDELYSISFESLTSKPDLLSSLYFEIPTIKNGWAKIYYCNGGLLENVDAKIIDAEISGNAVQFHATQSAPFGIVYIDSTTNSTETAAKGGIIVQSPSDRSETLAQSKSNTHKLTINAPDDEEDEEDTFWSIVFQIIMLIVFLAAYLIIINLIVNLSLILIERIKGFIKKHNTDDHSIGKQ